MLMTICGAHVVSVALHHGYEPVASVQKNKHHLRIVNHGRLDKHPRQLLPTNGKLPNPAQSHIGGPAELDLYRTVRTVESVSSSKPFAHSQKPAHDEERSWIVDIGGKHAAECDGVQKRKV